MKLAFSIEEKLGPHWVVLDGEDFYDRLELAVSLTNALSIDWVPVLCYCGRVERAVSVMEIADALCLDPGDVSRCLIRLEKEKLLDATAQAGTYVFAPGRRTTGERVSFSSSAGTN
jgi:hypothetical protein